MVKKNSAVSSAEFCRRNCSSLTAFLRFCEFGYASCQGHMVAHPDDCIMECLLTDTPSPRPGPHDTPPILRMHIPHIENIMCIRILNASSQTSIHQGGMNNPKEKVHTTQLQLALQKPQRQDIYIHRARLSMVMLELGCTTRNCGTTTSQRRGPWERVWLDHVELISRKGIRPPLHLEPSPSLHPSLQAGATAVEVQNAGCPGLPTPLLYPPLCRALAAVPGVR